MSGSENSAIKTITSNRNLANSVNGKYFNRTYKKSYVNKTFNDPKDEARWKRARLINKIISIMVFIMFSVFIVYLLSSILSIPINPLD